MASVNDVDDKESMAQPRPRAIFVVGASSVGKTTLCRALAKEFGIDQSKHIQEIARHVMRTQGFSRETVHQYAMQHAIMSAQLVAEGAILGHANTHDRVLLLSDRSAVDPIVYAMTSNVENKAENAAKLLHDTSFQSILPFYRESLFGMCRMC